MISFDFKSLDKTIPNRWIYRLLLVTSTIIVILVGMLFLPWQQTVMGEGTLIAQNPSERGYMIASTVDGFVETIYVRENQKVKKGDKLFRMVDLDQNYSQRIDRMDESINNQIVYTNEEFETLAKNRGNLVEQMENGGQLYEKRLRQAQEEFKSLEFKKTAIQQSYSVEKANYERTKALFHDAIESKRSLERSENSYAKAKAEWEKVNIDLDIQKRNLDIIRQEKEQYLLDSLHKIRVADNTMNSAQVRLNGLKRDDERQKTDIARYATSDVVAQKDGHVLRVLVNDKNRYISKGDDVVHFAPEITTRTILLKISDFNMPLIKKGLPVRIRFYGWPALEVSGWPKIQYGTFSGIIDRVDPISFEQGFYYAYIIENPKEPWPSDQILRVGTRGTVWARLSTVPIWYEIWRTMNAAPPRMVKPEKSI
jgi:multidrug efflux pump subunit AcrA (membrane-fusion protein)